MRSCWLLTVVIIAIWLVGPGHSTASRAPIQPDPNWAFVQQELATAREMRTLGQPGYGEILRRSAAGLAKLGHASDAIEVLEELIATPETALDTPSAFRQIAQYRHRQGRIGEAIAAFRQQIAAYDADPDLIQRFPVGYASGIVQVAELLAQTGSIDEAIAMNDRLLGPRRSWFDIRVQREGLARRVRLLQQKGDSAAAIEAIDELFVAFPDYGRENGGAVTLRLNRARLADPTGVSDQYALALLDLWNDPELRSHRRILNVGLELIRVRTERGEHEEALDAAMAVLERIDSHREAWLQQAANITNIVRELRSHETSALARLQSADSAGRRDLAIYAVQRLLLLEESQARRASLQEQLNRLLQLP
jgi:tetratricopeptide (TPR) repeat protein